MRKRGHPECATAGFMVGSREGVIPFAHPLAIPPILHPAPSMSTPYGLDLKPYAPVAACGFGASFECVAGQQAGADLGGAGTACLLPSGEITVLSAGACAVAMGNPLGGSACLPVAAADLFLAPTGDVMSAVPMLGRSSEVPLATSPTPAAVQAGASARALARAVEAPSLSPIGAIELENALKLLKLFEARVSSAATGGAGAKEVALDLKPAGPLGKLKTALQGDSGLPAGAVQTLKDAGQGQWSPAAALPTTLRIGPKKADSRLVKVHLNTQHGSVTPLGTFTAKNGARVPVEAVVTRRGPSMRVVVRERSALP